MESSEKTLKISEEHFQLTKAIHTYQNMIDKCKKVTRLGNYHKHYKQHLEKHCDKLRETQVSKLQLLIPPGVGTDHNFNVFRFLSSKLPKLKVAFPVVDTLLFSPRTQVLIRNHPEGQLEVHEGPMGVQEFLKGLKFNNSGAPVCLAKPENGKLMLFESVLNLSRFLAESSFQGSLQNFVASEHLQVVRVLWKDSGNVRSYLIRKKDLNHNPCYLKVQNKSKPLNKIFASTQSSEATEVLEEDSLKPAQTYQESLNLPFGVKKHPKAHFRSISVLNNINHQENPSTQLLSIHEHPVNDLGLSSFLEQLKNKCKELKVHPWTEEEPETLFLSEKDAEKFLVVGTDPEQLEVTELKTVYPQVLSTLLKVAELVDRHLLRQKKSLKELSLDFLKDHEWQLLKVQDIKINECLSDFRDVPAPFNKLTFSSFVPPLKNQHKKFDMFLVKIRNIPSKRPEPPLLHKRTMASTQTPMPIRYPLVREKSKGSISRLREKFDSFLKKTEELKVFDDLKLDQQKQLLIESYQDSFSLNAKHMKEVEVMKTSNDLEVSASFHKDDETKPKNVTSSFKPVINEYNSMMIHVRRVNLRKKKPLIEFYGGQDFFRKVIKDFRTRVKTIENISRKVSTMTSESKHGMFFKGLACVFNSDLTLNFRQLVRQRHKNLAIDNETYKSFCGIFLAVLQEARISNEDLEVINDNLLSFTGAICCPNKNLSNKGR